MARALLVYPEVTELLAAYKEKHPRAAANSPDSGLTETRKSGFNVLAVSVVQIPPEMTFGFLILVNVKVCGQLCNGNHHFSRCGVNLFIWQVVAPALFESH